MVNHVKQWIRMGHYTSYEDFATKHIGPAPLCLVCRQRPVMFRSIIRGWKLRCSHADCKQVFISRSVESLRKRTRSKHPLLLVHVQEHMQLYIDLHDVASNELVTLPYDGKQVERRKVYSYISKKLSSEEIVQLDRELCCVVCNNASFRVNPFKNKSDRKQTCTKQCADRLAQENRDTYRPSQRIQALRQTLSAPRYHGMINGVQVAFLRNDLRKLPQPLFLGPESEFDEFVRGALNQRCVGCNSLLSLSRALSKIRSSETDNKRLHFCNPACYFTFRRSPKGRRMFAASPETNKKISESMKARIASGAWTPMVTNSWGKTRMVVDGVPFRSSWEAAFYIRNPNATYESTRIRYTGLDCQEHWYLVDFTIGKSVYEIKPDSTVGHPTSQLKVAAALEHCKSNNMRYTVIGDSWFRTNYQLYASADPHRFSDHAKFMRSMRQFDANH